MLFSTVIIIQFSSVKSLSHVRLFVTPWITTCQAFLSISNSWSPPKPMFIELVMPSNHHISVVPFSSCPQSFPASGSFQMSQFFASGGQNIGVSASTSVLPMNTQDWSPLGWTNLDSILKSKDITLPSKVCLVKSYGFSNSHIWMWELDFKESWMLKNWCFWTVVLEITLESLGLQGDPTSPS